MASRRRTPAHSLAVGTVVLVTWVTCAVCLDAHGPRSGDKRLDKPRDWTRVRPLEPRGARAIEIGYAESATFRAFVDEIEESDLVVYIDTDPFRTHTTEAFLEFLSANAGLRYAIAWVDPRHDDRQIVALVGHELEHAVELARACEVATREQFLAFYQSHGHVSGVEQYETARAHDATVRIARELAGAQLAADLGRSR